MTELEDYNKDDELVLLRVTRSDAKVWRKMVDERKAYDTIIQKIKLNWMWIVGAGVLTMFGLYEKFQAYLFGTIK